MSAEPTGREIAVVGMAGRFPGARDLPRFWENLRDGVEAVTFLSDEELAAAGVPPEVAADPSYVRAASLLDDVDRFDAGFFGYTPREAEILDPQQRLFLEHVWAALEDAGYAPGAYRGLIGIYAGVAWNTYLLTQLVSHPELFAGGNGFQVFISNDKDFMPTRASYKLDLKGPSMIVQTSCSTSLVATHLACLSLLNYECDIALAGGVTVRVPQREGYFYLDGGLASPDGHCRAFDERAAGTIFGSGVGVVALKRLAEAREDGDAIRAVIKGTAINNDGSVKVSYTAPSVEGQAEVIAAAQAVAGVAPETVGYVEAHGTGTALGDPIEVAALTKVFRAATAERGFCALGSVKTNVGHLDAAAGVAGLLKTVLALEHRTIPPSLHYERPNPKIDFPSSPFYVAARAQEWRPRGGAPLRAGVSSFGVGGTNAHAVLEEAPAREPAAAWARPWQILPVSARSATALEEATVQLAAALAGDPGLDLADAAYTLQVGRTVFRHRRVLVARDREEAAAALREGGPEVLTAVDVEDPRERPVAFLFTGQGAQHPGMGRELYETEPGFRERLDRCAELLLPLLGEDLRGLLFPGPDADPEEAARRLERTALAQPALFAYEWSLAGLWMDWGVRPQALLGHSVGEYVAACLAGVFTLEDALALVAERGRLMQELPPGAMLALPLPEEEVLNLIAGTGLALAAVNEPARSVVSGPAEAVERLARELAGKGTEGRRLHTSHAFHSAMMDPILGRFAERVGRVRLAPPRIPFVSNLSGTWIADTEATDPAYWARHLRGTVRFAAGIDLLRAEPERVLLEVGPGRTLATLARRPPRPDDRTVVVASTPHPRDGGSEPAALMGALGRLWLAGVPIDWAALHAGEGRRRVPLPTYPFERRRFWIEGRPGAARPAAAPAAEEVPAKRADPASWLVVPTWKRSVPLRPLADMAGRRVLVLADGLGLGGALARRLREGGAVVAEAAAAEGFERALAALDGAPEEVVHLWSLDAPATGDPAAVERTLELGFASLLALARALGERDRPCRILAVTAGAFAVVGGERLAPDRATLLGPCRVIPQEMPHLACRFVDVEDQRIDRQADLLLSELAASEPVVAHRGGRRWIQAFEPAGWDGGEPPLRALRPDGAYLLTGGLDGAGFALARRLAAPGRRLLLLEAAPLAAEDPRLARARELERQGAEVLVETVDLADPAAVARAVLVGRARFGALHGALHAAGAAGERAFRTVQETGPEEASWHFVPKVHGLLALDRALAGLDLDFRLLASSLAGVLGGLGAAALAAADLFLDAFAQASEEDGPAAPARWLSVGWDAFRAAAGEDGGIAALRSDLAELALTPDEGETVLRLVLAGATAPCVAVSAGDLAARLARARKPGAARPAAAAQGPRHPRPALPTPYAPPEGELERKVAEVWAQVFGFEQVGAHDNFFELGGDSFLAIQVVSRLRAELGMEIPVAKLYQGTTARALARLLGEDEEESGRQRAAQLEERRESMSQRHEFQRLRRERRRAASMGNAEN